MPNFRLSGEREREERRKSCERREQERKKSNLIAMGKK
jgi:hypothetical protein